MGRNAPLPVIPGYDVRGELGRGGMGVVFEGVNLERQRRVAIKMMLSQAVADLSAIVRFRLEAEAIAALRHRHVVRIHEVGISNAAPFMVLEFAEAGTLAHLVKQQIRPPHEAARIAHSVAMGVGHAHSRGIIHRDLKPSNVLVFADGSIKVSDFGLTKFQKPREEINFHCTINLSAFQSMLAAPTTPSVPLERAEVQRLVEELASQRSSNLNDPNEATVIMKTVDFAVEANMQLARRRESRNQRAALTETGDLLGSPRYMAPEQIQDSANVGPAADVHAIGCILYELITGRQLIQGKSISEVMIAVMHGKRDKLPRHASRQLGDIFTHCVKPDPADRYSHASELAEELGRFLSRSAKQHSKELAPFPADNIGPDDSGAASRARVTRRWWPFGRKPGGPSNEK